MKSSFALTGLMGATALGQALTADMIDSMGNNTLFTRWRPQNHFIAPAGWMNDPCGLMYDPTEDIYHAFYQWHPEHINWGNISWGHATSKDMISWTDVGGWEGTDALALGPAGNGSYDGLGIFSGTAQPVNMTGGIDGTLLIFYTSVSKLPTSWTLPYLNGTESQSLAMSHDGGKTWEQYENNPVIEGPPGDWNITGFRDPFFEPMPALDAILGQQEPHYYAVFGSGIKGVGPRMPLWSAPASNLANWTFLGSLFEPADNTSLGAVLPTGSYGFNFEVSGFFTLPDEDGHLHYFVNMGSEGGNVSFHESAHWALWNEGHVTRRANGSAQFTPISGGAGDWGNLYALTSFNDTKNDRRVQYGWAPEDITGGGGLFSAKQQGFQGALSLPRELFVHTVKNVVNMDGVLGEMGNSYLSQNLDGSFTAQTLGVKPLEDVVTGLRNGSTQHSWPGRTYNGSQTLVANGSAHMELSTVVSSATGPCGVRIGVSPDGREYTNIYYEPANNTVVVDRTHSSLIDGFANSSVIGYFYPYTIQGEYGNATQEPLVWDIFVDGSLVEVYINDRFALTTRIYPSMQSSTGVGIYVASGASATFDSIDSWSSLYNVFPERPLNSSSQLVWDTVEQTNNRTWWTGN
ncbi:glycosyl hydrolase-like proteins family 32 superfamily [Aureobasidium pullulans]|nr:glycosyl hydrolase-like proteins family 32 superfamily [Aureobasidium pullulans]